MVSLFGTASESRLEIADRAPCVLRSLPPCKGLPHLRGAGGRQHCTRGLAGVETTLGRRATRSSPACGEWRPRGLPPALRIAHCLRVAERQQEHTGPRALGGFELARLYSLRALVGKRLARVKRRLGPPSGGRPEGGWGRLSHRLPIPLGTSLPPWEDLPRPHQRHHLRRCHKSTSRLT